MHEYRGLPLEPVSDRPCVIVLGCFDGVHIGHQALLQRACFLAGHHKDVVVVSIVERSSFGTLIITDAHRKRLLGYYGAHICVELDFDTIKTWPAEDFVQKLTSLIQIDTWVYGDELSFGYQKKGSSELLAKMIPSVRLVQVPPILYQGQRVSSTAIRVALKQNRDVHAMLNRPFSIYTEVYPVNSHTLMCDCSALAIPQVVWQVCVLTEQKARIGKFDGKESFLLVKDHGIYERQSLEIVPVRYARSLT